MLMGCVGLVFQQQQKKYSHKTEFLWLVIIWFMKFHIKGMFLSTRSWFLFTLIKLLQILQGQGLNI